MILSDYGKRTERYTDIAMTLMARDSKGFGQQTMTGVEEQERKV